MEMEDAVFGERQEAVEDAGRDRRMCKLNRAQIKHAYAALYFFSSTRAHARSKYDYLLSPAGEERCQLLHSLLHTAYMRRIVSQTMNNSAPRREYVSKNLFVAIYTLAPAEPL